ncbi:MAG: DUF1361 domain-containing protein [Chloroflexi bacterium]|nr:MAG: DUF1361 domain-containing protein [Chloroflexota bacterium]
MKKDVSAGVDLSLLFVLMSVASVFSVGLEVMRVMYTGAPHYLFLIWNLILAWMPFVFAVGAFVVRQKRPFSLLLAGYWLLFFPNAPYIVTDLIHLRPTAVAPIWYDAILLFSFALTGLLLGLVSLYLMQLVIESWFGRMAGWLFVSGSLLLGGFGVYIGRFLRWNSWDIFTDPMRLVQDILLNITTPHLGLKTAVVTGSLAVVFALAYFTMLALTRLAPRPELQQS